MAFARRTMRCSSSPSLTIFTRSARSAALRKLQFVFTRRLESIPLNSVKRFSDGRGIPLYLKKEIALIGDTMNATARIVETCRETKNRVLASAALLDRLAALPPDGTRLRLGEFPCAARSGRWSSGRWRRMLTGDRPPLPRYLRGCDPLPVRAQDQTLGPTVGTRPDGATQGGSRRRAVVANRPWTDRRAESGDS